MCLNLCVCDEVRTSMVETGHWITAAGMRTVSNTFDRFDTFDIEASIPYFFIQCDPGNTTEVRGACPKDGCKHEWEISVLLFMLKFLQQMLLQERSYRSQRCHCFRTRKYSFGKKGTSIILSCDSIQIFAVKKYSDGVRTIGKYLRFSRGNMLLSFFWWSCWGRALYCCL